MYRDFTYVDDLVRAISLLIDVIPERPAHLDDIQKYSLSPVAPYRVVNIGNSEKIGLLDFIDAIEEALNKKAIRNYMPSDWRCPATWANSDLLNLLTGYRPQTNFKDGIRKFVEWFQDYYEK